MEIPRADYQIILFYFLFYFLTAPAIDKAAGEGSSWPYYTLISVLETLRLHKNEISIFERGGKSKIWPVGYTCMQSANNPVKLLFS